MKLGGKSLAVLLLFIGLVLVNYLASLFPMRADLTANKIYSLSDGTRQMLARIEDPIDLRLYFSRSLEALPIWFKNYASRVEEMLRQYVAASDGHIRLEVIDPKPDTDEETAAQRAGLSPQHLSNGETLYFGLVATQAEQEKTIPFFTTNRERFLEYDISQAIYSVQQYDKPKLGLISGLPLRSQMPFPMQGQQPQPDQLVISQWEQTFEIVPVEASAESLPDDLAVLAVIHPQNLSDQLQFAIDQFLLGGKPVFIAVDPSSTYFKAQQRQNMMFGGPQPGLSSDLPRLFNGWGIDYDASVVVGDLSLGLQANTQAGPIAYPVWLNLGTEQLNSDTLPTSSLKSMWLIESGSFNVATDRGYEITPLLHTTTQSGTVASSLLAMSPPQEVARQIKSGGIAKTLAVEVRGTFKTAFPEGKPRKPDTDDSKSTSTEDDQKDATTTASADDDATTSTTDDAKADQDGEKSSDDFLKESSSPGTLVLIADTDWLLDDYSVRRMNFLGLQAVEPRNDNLAFAGNIADFLGGSRDLISIRGKRPSERPFEVYHQMEVVAQQRYQAELDQLEQKQTEVEEQLNKLVSQQTEGHQLIATPEMQQAIDQYRDQQADLRTRIRKIRLALRQGIEGLELRLKVLNLLGIPILIIIGAVWFFVTRSRRQRAA